MSLVDGNGLSAADIAAVTGNNGNGFGFGGDGAWLILILLLFAAFNGNGWGNNAGGAGGYPFMMANVDNGVQRGFDQSAVMGALTGINGAITNGFADAAVAQCNQTASMLQGFSGLQMQMSNVGSNLTNVMMQNEMARQQCCCDTKQAIADLKYTIATEACSDRAAVSAGVQTIIDKINQQELENLKAQNANLQTQINMQNLAASQATQTAQLVADNNAQTAALINRIAPYPVPSYTVSNPYVNCGCNQNNCCGVA